MKIGLPKYFTIEDTRLTGIYFLLFRGEVVYIGQTVNLLSRVINHDKAGQFDEIRFIPCDERKLKKYEKRWIIKFRPKLNTTYLFVMIGAHAWCRGGRGSRRRVPINLQKCQ